MNFMGTFYNRSLKKYSSNLAQNCSLGVVGYNLGNALKNTVSAGFFIAKIVFSQRIFSFLPADFLLCAAQKNGVSDPVFVCSPVFCGNMYCRRAVPFSPAVRIMPSALFGDTLDSFLKQDFQLSSHLNIGFSRCPRIVLPAEQNLYGGKSWKDL